MPKFDENQWYHIYIGESKANALVGTELVFGDPRLEDTTKRNSTVGSVFMSLNQLEKEERTQKWQIIPFDSDYYVLRSSASGINGYLGATYAQDRTNLSSATQARIVRDTVSDASVYWNISSWRDGTYFLTNKANGTDLLLEIGGEHDNEDGTEAHMSSNFTLIGKRQFSFETVGTVNGKDIGHINNPDWSRSAIKLPATTSSSTSSSATPTSSGSSDTNPASPVDPIRNSSGGLSTGAKAGIGAGVGAVVLITLIVLSLLLMRKRQAAISTHEMNPYTQLKGYGDNVAIRYAHVGVAEKPELDSNAQRAELPHVNPSPAELAGGELRQELAGGDRYPNR